MCDVYKTEISAINKILKARGLRLGADVQLQNAPSLKNLCGNAILELCHTPRNFTVSFEADDTVGVINYESVKIRINLNSALTELN